MNPNQKQPDPMEQAVTGTLGEMARSLVIARAEAIALSQQLQAARDQIAAMQQSGASSQQQE